MSIQQAMDKYMRLYKSHKARNPAIARAYYIRIEELRRQHYKYFYKK